MHTCIHAYYMFQYTFTPISAYNHMGNLVTYYSRDCLQILCKLVIFKRLPACYLSHFFHPLSPPTPPQPISLILLVSFSTCLFMYLYAYVCIFMHLCVHVCIHKYIHLIGHTYLLNYETEWWLNCWVGGTEDIVAFNEILSRPPSTITTITVSLLLLNEFVSFNTA